MKAWRLIVHALKTFAAYPLFLLPLLTVWAVYGSGVLYFRYRFPWKQYGAWMDLGVTFLFIFALSFLILIGFTVMLEMIRQFETGKPSVLRALGRILGKDVFRVLPLALAWAIVWFILTIIEAVLSSDKNDSSDDDSMTAENAAKTLASFDDFSFSEAFISALQKGVRMVTFLILPAIAWENLGTYKAMKRGLAVFRAHLGLVATGYALTYVAAAIVFIPSAIVLWLGTGKHGHPPLVHFPSYVWDATIIYMGFAWSFSIYLEQMFMAQLYLWHLRWREAVSAAAAEGRSAPKFDSVPQPVLLKRSPALFAEG